MEKQIPLCIQLISLCDSFLYNTLHSLSVHYFELLIRGGGAIQGFTRVSPPL